MLPTNLASTPNPRSLVLLNHRGEALDDLRSWLQDRGWRVHLSLEISASLELIAARPEAVVVLWPESFHAGHAEWRALLSRLGPMSRNAVLLITGPRPSAVFLQDLQEQLSGPSDWMESEAAYEEFETRVRNLRRMARLFEHSQKHVELLTDQLLTDHKTGLFNDRLFRKRLREEFDRSRRHKTNFTLGLLDLDNFKQINDRFSYEFGDHVLRSTAQILRDNMRSIDLPARIGGDEFGILLPNTALDEALAVAHRIRAASLESPTELNGQQIWIQLSQGYATLSGQDLADPVQLFLQANEALKAAKKSGKNRISICKAEAS